MTKVLFKKPYPPCDETQTITNITQSPNVYFNQVEITWDPVPGVNQYQFWDDYNKFVRLVSTNKVLLTADEIAAPNTTDDLGVRNNCGGTPGPWNWDSMTTPGCSVSITNLQASNITSTSADITWDEIPYVWRYDIWHSDGNVFTNLKGCKQNFRNLINLTPGAQNIDIGVRARCFNGSPLGSYSWIQIDLL